MKIPILLSPQALKAVQEAWKRIDDLEQKCAAARAEGQSAKGSSERARRDSQARVDRLQVITMTQSVNIIISNDVMRRTDIVFHALPTQHDDLNRLLSCWWW